MGYVTAREVSGLGASTATLKPAEWTLAPVAPVSAPETSPVTSAPVSATRPVIVKRSPWKMYAAVAALGVVGLMVIGRSK